MTQGGIILLPPPKEYSHSNLPNGASHDEDMNGIYPAWRGFFVLQCSPVLQGVLTPNTTVTLSHDTKHWSNYPMLDDLRRLATKGVLPTQQQVTIEHSRYNIEKY